MNNDTGTQNPLQNNNAQKHNYCRLMKIKAKTLRLALLSSHGQHTGRQHQPTLEGMS